MRLALTIPEFVLLPENANRTILAGESGMSVSLTLGSKTRPGGYFTDLSRLIYERFKPRSR
jgi:hypothetical protein